MAGLVVGAVGPPPVAVCIGKGCASLCCCPWALRRWSHYHLVPRPAVAAGKFRRPWDAKDMMRRLKFPRCAWLALGMLLALHALAGEQHFTAIQVENNESFQQYEGFQLATLA